MIATVLQLIPTKYSIDYYVHVAIIIMVALIQRAMDIAQSPPVVHTQITNMLTTKWRIPRHDVNDDRCIWCEYYIQRQCPATNYQMPFQMHWLNAAVINKRYRDIPSSAAVGQPVCAVIANVWYVHLCVPVHCAVCTCWVTHLNHKYPTTNQNQNHSVMHQHKWMNSM